MVGWGKRVGSARFAWLPIPNLGGRAILSLRRPCAFPRPFYPTRPSRTRLQKRIQAHRLNSGMVRRKA